jgi:hypothetical protein
VESSIDSEKAMKSKRRAVIALIIFAIVIEIATVIIMPIQYLMTGRQAELKLKSHLGSLSQSLTPTLI